MLHCIVYLINKKERKRKQKEIEKKKMKKKNNKNCSEFAMSENCGRISAGATPPTQSWIR